MKTLAKKIGSTVLAVSVFSMLTFGFPSGAFASHSNDGGSDPSIKEITKRTTTSITLPIKFEKREGDRVNIKVSIQNMKSGEKFTQSFKTRLNKDDGRKKIVITNLKSGTEYKFKVKIKKRNDSKYSDWSDSRKASTK